MEKESEILYVVGTDGTLQKYRQPTRECSRTLTPMTEGHDAPPEESEHRTFSCVRNGKYVGAGYLISSRQKKKGKPSGRNPGTRLVSCPKFPPEFNSVPSERVTRRWQSAKAVDLSAGVGFSQGLGHSQFQVVVVSASSSVSYADMWRIRKVSVWCINDVEASTTVTIVPTGADTSDNNFNDRERAFTCSSRSEADPGYMAIVPDPDTPMGMWHKTLSTDTGNVLFVFTIDYGGASSGNWNTVTMDIDFEYVPNTYGAASTYTRTPGATAAGTMGGYNLFNTGTGMLLVGCNNIA